MSTSLKASRFMEANQRSPVVYGSVEKHTFTYRLADGSVWTFPRREARSIEEPRWAHMEEWRGKHVQENGSFPPKTKTLFPRPVYSGDNASSPIDEVNLVRA